VLDLLVVVDVDGTLTRSDVRGYVETVYMGVYDYIHTGVVSYLNFTVSLFPLPFPPSLSACGIQRPLQNAGTRS
jgi:hypothetical protein